MSGGSDRDWAQRLLLALFPRRFRDRFGRGFLDVLERDRAAAAKRGRGPLAWFWVRNAASALVNAVKMRNADTQLMSDWVQDVRHGFRQLLRSGGSSAVAVVTLALGIGATSSVLSVIDATMLRPLPYPEPAQLVRVHPELQLADRVARPTPSMEDMRAWQSAADVFASVAGWGTAFRGRVVVGGEPERIEVLHFTEDYLPMHGVTPLMGRGFRRGDSDPDGPLVAMLGHGYWKRRYGGRQDVIGETVRFESEIATIVGVLPAWFHAGTPVSLPLRVPAEELSRRGTGRVGVYARLRANVTIEQAEERLSAAMVGMPGPEGSTVPVRARVTPRLESATARNRPTVQVLGGAVSLILLIACVNVAALLLGRGASRSSEMAVRASLGAGRIRLLRQMLIESFVLALPAALLGTLFAWASLEAIVANLPLSMPSDASVSLNGTVLGLTAALLVPIALLFGMLPAIRLSRVRVGSALHGGGGRTTGSALSRRTGQALIMAELALAVVLLAGAGLMIRSFARISAVDLGFEPTGLMTMEVLPLDRIPAVHEEYYAALVARARTIPGVSSAGLVDNFVLGDVTRFASVSVAGTSTGSTVFEVLPGYFETIGAELVAGRFPNGRDYTAGARAAVINESAARELFSGEPPTGRALAVGSGAEPWVVFGVVADLRHGGPLEPGIDQPQVFLPLDSSESDLNQAMTVVVRTLGDRPGLADDLRNLAHSIGPPVLVERIRGAEDWLGDRVTTPRRRTVLLGLLGGLGFALALVGVLGVTSYAVARRTAEIGVRVAVGARPAQVVGTVLWDSAVPIVVGTAVGVGASMLVTRVIESFLFETAPNDPATLSAVALTLAMAACAAALVPALRATKVHPARTLRAE